MIRVLFFLVCLAEIIGLNIFLTRWMEGGPWSWLASAGLTIIADLMIIMAVLGLRELLRGN